MEKKKTTKKTPKTLICSTVIEEWQTMHILIKLSSTDSSIWLCIVVFFLFFFLFFFCFVLFCFFSQYYDKALG